MGSLALPPTSRTRERLVPGSDTESYWFKWLWTWKVLSCHLLSCCSCHHTCAILEKKLNKMTWEKYCFQLKSSTDNHLIVSSWYNELTTGPPNAVLLSFPLFSVVWKKKKGWSQHPGSQVHLPDLSQPHGWAQPSGSPICDPSHPEEEADGCCCAHSHGLTPEVSLVAQPSC